MPAAVAGIQIVLTASPLPRWWWLDATAVRGISIVRENLYGLSIAKSAEAAGTASAGSVLQGSRLQGS